MIVGSVVTDFESLPVTIAVFVQRSPRRIKRAVGAIILSLVAKFPAGILRDIADASLIPIRVAGAVPAHDWGRLVLFLSGLRAGDCW